MITSEHMGLIVTLVLVALAIFILAGMYNSLVQLRVRTESAWSDIDVQLSAVMTSSRTWWKQLKATPRTRRAHLKT